MFATAAENHTAQLNRTIPDEDRRREPRYPHSFSIEISGFDHSGRFFTEQTWTVDASLCGCRFNLRTAVERGSVVAIRILNAEGRSPLDRPTLLFQVAHTQQSERGWTVGVWKLQSSKTWTSQVETAEPPANVSR